MYGWVKSLRVLPVSGANQLRCNKCNERLLNRTTCANRTVEDCSVQYPNQPVACVRSVQTFSDGKSDTQFTTRT